MPCLNLAPTDCHTTIIFPWWGVNNVNHVRSKSRKKNTPPSKKFHHVLFQWARKGVMAVEEWKNENNRDLSFFRDEGITNPARSADGLVAPPPSSLTQCYLRRWREEQSTLVGKGVKGERSSEPRVFLLLIVPLTTRPRRKKTTLWSPVSHPSSVTLSGARADVGSISEQKQET